MKENTRFNHKLNSLYNEKHEYYTHLVAEKCNKLCYSTNKRVICNYKLKNWTMRPLCNIHLYILHDYKKKYPNLIKKSIFNTAQPLFKNEKPIKDKPNINYNYYNTNTYINTFFKEMQKWN